MGNFTESLPLVRDHEIRGRMTWAKQQAQPPEDAARSATGTEALIAAWRGNSSNRSMSMAAHLRRNRSRRSPGGGDGPICSTRGFPIDRLKNFSVKYS